MESRRYFCDDFIRDILVRLPTKSLLRFKSISKSWTSLIAADLCFRNNSPKIIIINITSPRHPRDWFSLDLWSPGKLEKLDLSAEFEEDMKSCTPWPVGSCNGLLLFSDWDGTRFWMLNVSTRECHSIIVPKVRSLELKFKSFGFGYDSVNDDYKVIGIFSYEDKHEISAASVYSLRNDAWRTMPTLKGLDSHCTIRGTKHGVLVGGKVHWIATSPHRDVPYILAFDVTREDFLEIAKLPKAEDSKTCFDILRELSGCLTVTEITRDSYYVVVAVWVLNESGWVQLLKTNPNDTRNRDFRFMAPLAYSKNGDEVLMENADFCFWYNKENGKVDRLCGSGWQITICSDTLVSIRAYREAMRRKNQGKRRRICK